MIARATLALILAGPALVATMTAGSANAAATTVIRKTGPSHSSPREKSSLITHRRHRASSQAASVRGGRRDQAPAVVASFDDGLAYDTPRDRQGHPMRSGTASISSLGASAGAWQTGIASWYGGPQWQGRRMSDGSRYDQSELTAAHVSLPLGSMVRVTLMDASRSVVVRITDRPGTRKRIIDLSRAAAAQLGILSAGVAKVQLQPL